MTELQDNLPVGWDCKIDSLTGKYYFINHFTKLTTWEDPRTRYRPLNGTPKHFTNMNVEHIPLQHGSPVLNRHYVYPSQMSPIPAFMPAHYSPKTNPFHQEFRNMPRMSPLSVRSSKVQDTSLTVVDVDEAVSKINAMFPTVQESHIRVLMKKYHNREALVISALQVDKYPITTPGPTPPPQRNIQHPNVHALQTTSTPPLGLRCSSSRGGSPILRPGSGTSSTYTGSPLIGDGYRYSPRPHSSPKLKLRYMKSLFPQAEETVILEVLYGNESNIQKSTEALKEMGFQQKDTVKAAQQKIEAKKEQERIEKEDKKKKATPPPIPKLKTNEEKSALKKKLQAKYKDVAHHLIKIALESVDFNEKRAMQILDIMVKEDSEKNTPVAPKKDIDKKTLIEPIVETKETILPISQSRQSIKSLLKSEKIDKDKNVYSRVIEDLKQDYKSPNLSSTTGANPDMTKGPNQKILLEDYVKWHGPNQDYCKGTQKGLAKGPSMSLLTNRTYQPCGSNAELRKGPQFGLAKGSIFSQLKNVVIGESRGK